MSVSKDIIISDNDEIDTKSNDNQEEINEPITISTNTTKIKLDDILSKSNQIVYKTGKNKPKINNKMIKNDTKIKTLGKKITNVAEKQNIIYMIQKYQSSTIFGDYITKDLKINYDEASLNKKSLTELNTIITKIRLNLDNKNLNKMYDSVLFGSTTLVETISKPIVNVDGFSKLLQENDQFINCWERYKCESIMPTIPPYLQMMFIVSQTYFLAYAMNKMKEPSEDTLKIVADIEKEIEMEAKQKEEMRQVGAKPKTKEENNNDVITPPIITNGMSI